MTKHIDLPMNVHTVPPMVAWAFNRVPIGVQGACSSPIYGPQILYLESCRTYNLSCPMCLRHMPPSSEQTGNNNPREYEEGLNNARPIETLRIMPQGGITIIITFIIITKYHS